MELDDLDNLNKNDFLPLLSQNIKQELFDPGQEETLCDSPDKQPQVRVDEGTPVDFHEILILICIVMALRCRLELCLHSKELHWY